MDRIELLETTNDALVNQILKDIEKEFGMVPKLWKAYANYPVLFKSNWNKQVSIMGEGYLSAVLKQAVAYIVSIENSCEYCIDAHKMMLESIGMDSESLESNVESTMLSKKEILLFNFAKKIAKDSTKISDDLFLELKSNNITTKEILELIGVVELFTGYNIFLNSMGIAGGSL